MSDSEPRLPELFNLATEERHTLQNASISLGRASTNAIILRDDGYASAEHARIFWDQGQWWVEDLKSSNGTHVNEKQITEPWSLSPGDVIKVVRTFFRIQ